MTVAVFAPPQGQSIEVPRTVLFSTLHQEAISGKDTPLALWTYPRYRYQLKFNFLRTAAAYLQWQYLQNFYETQLGSFGVWAYRDGDDSTATAQAFGTGDGVTTAFQLYRALPSQSALSPVNYVVGTPLVFRAGTSAVGNFTISNGVVTFTDAPPANGAALTWTGVYNWLVRFDNDNLDFNKMVDSIFELEKLTFTTIKYP